jgi:hypothetical protein
VVRFEGEATLVELIAKKRQWLLTIQGVHPLKLVDHFTLDVLLRIRERVPRQPRALPPDASEAKRSPMNSLKFFGV